MPNIWKFKRKFPRNHILEEQVKFYSVGAKNIYISLCVAFFWLVLCSFFCISFSSSLRLTFNSSYSRLKPDEALIHLLVTH